MLFDFTNFDVIFILVQNHLSQLIMRQSLVEFSSQVGVTVVDLADSSCTAPLSLGGISSHIKSKVVPFLWLTNTHRPYTKRLFHHENQRMGVRVVHIEYYCYCYY